MPTLIKPTVDEVQKPQAAIIAHVWGDRLINVGILDPNGRWFGETSVTLVQEGDPLPEGRYCTWMPYQIGQAKPKTDPIAA